MGKYLTSVFFLFNLVKSLTNSGRFLGPWGRKRGVVGTDRRGKGWRKGEKCLRNQEKGQPGPLHNFAKG